MYEVTSMKEDIIIYSFILLIGTFYLALGLVGAALILELIFYILGV